MPEEAWKQGECGGNDQVRHDEIRRMAGKNVSSSRCINVLLDGLARGTYAGWKIYEKDIQCESVWKKKPRTTQINLRRQIKRVLSDGKIKSTRHRRKCMKGLMSVEEAKEVCKSREKWRSILSAYPARDMAWWYVCI